MGCGSAGDAFSVDTMDCSLEAPCTGSDCFCEGLSAGGWATFALVCSAKVSTSKQVQTKEVS